MEMLYVVYDEKLKGKWPCMSFHGVLTTDVLIEITTFFKFQISEGETQTM